MAAAPSTTSASNTSPHKSRGSTSANSRKNKPRSNTTNPTNNIMNNVAKVPASSQHHNKNTNNMILPQRLMTRDWQAKLGVGIATGYGL